MITGAGVLRCFCLCWTSQAGETAAWTTEMFNHVRHTGSGRRASCSDLRASWWGWGSRRGKLWGSRVSCRKPSVLRLRSWNTRPLAPWSPPPCSSSCRGPSSSAYDPCRRTEGCSGLERREDLVVLIFITYCESLWMNDVSNPVTFHPRRSLTFGLTPRKPLQFGAPHLQTVFPFPKHSRL